MVGIRRRPRAASGSIAKGAWSPWTSRLGPLGSRWFWLAAVGLAPKGVFLHCSSEFEYTRSQPSHLQPNSSDIRSLHKQISVPERIRVGLFWDWVGRPEGAKSICVYSPRTPFIFFSLTSQCNVSPCFSETVQLQVYRQGLVLSGKSRY